MELILSGEDLSRLERRYGAGVRQIGSWNSDGVFACVSVSLTAVKMAADALGNPLLIAAASDLKGKPDPNGCFLRMLETFGPAFLQALAGVCGQPATWSAKAVDQEDAVVVEWALHY